MAIIIKESIVQVTIVVIIAVGSLSREPVERRIHNALYTHHQLLQNAITVLKLGTFFIDTLTERCIWYKSSL